MSTYPQANSDYKGYLLVFLGPVVATAVLFVLLPLLTQISRTPTETPEQTQIMMLKRQTQKAPEIRKKSEETRPREIKKTQTVEQKKQAPKFDILSGAAAGSIAGTVNIGMVDEGSLTGAGKDLFDVNKSLYATAFELYQVDQPPVATRQVKPLYPFLARRNNIEGKVVIRFIVDVNGDVLEPEVTESEPEGVFDEAAIDAILKYKFRPAQKDGKAVDCIVNAPMKFTVR